KLLHVGMELGEVIRVATSTPALAVRRAGAIGALAAGQPADVSLLELRAGHWSLPDAAGETEVVERLLIPRMVVTSGLVRAITSPLADSLTASPGS
ncbi:MAG TPA: hypothetical protein VNO54_26700, partial [Streptosporangiaceae bacterium]|nr:hypothetical protein [Streptosporangiaceae bacterium]